MLLLFLLYCRMTEKKKKMEHRTYCTPFTVLYQKQPHLSAKHRHGLIHSIFPRLDKRNSSGPVPPPSPPTAPPPPAPAPEPPTDNRTCHTHTQCNRAAPHPKAVKLKSHPVKRRPPEHHWRSARATGAGHHRPLHPEVGKVVPADVSTGRLDGSERGRPGCDRVGDAARDVRIVEGGGRR